MVAVGETGEIEDLTLLLTYLTSWDKNPRREYWDKPILRAWKGYDFAVLDSLQERGLIRFSGRAKSVYLAEKGIESAKDIKRPSGEDKTTFELV